MRFTFVLGSVLALQLGWFENDGFYKEYQHYLHCKATPDKQWMKDPRWQALQKRAQKKEAEWPAKKHKEDEEAKKEMAKIAEQFNGYRQ